jgi:hypothetical protein
MIPSPDKYTGQRVNFLNDKKSKIYAYDRKYEFNDLIKKAKKVPGVAQYNITRYDEKYSKPPKFGNIDK